jgi:hypothetical protein
MAGAWDLDPDFLAIAEAEHEKLGPSRVEEMIWFPGMF